MLLKLLACPLLVSAQEEHLLVILPEADQLNPK
jgi:hypothetical protein